MPPPNHSFVPGFTGNFAIWRQALQQSAYFNNSLRILAAATAAILLFLAAPAAQAAAHDQAAAQKKAMEKTVREYLLKNPQVLIDSIQALRQKEEAQAKRSVSQNLELMRGSLENNPQTPVGGNIKGDVAFIEFFDYRCPYCKRVSPYVMKLIKEDGNIRYVFKEFPILGPQSVVASKAALAAWYQDKTKYMSFHMLMMKNKGGLTRKKVMDYAARAGLDVKKLKQGMGSDKVKAEIARNAQAARALNINGTPTFIIGKTIVPGALSEEDLKDLVKIARADNAKNGKK
ncbi:MAG TPA: DsbA family protein [Alphaproteobacteria bacterium]|nr:DsbA family protein [Alphaproteobacteria bacterium]